MVYVTRKGVLELCSVILTEMFSCSFERNSTPLFSDLCHFSRIQAIRASMKLNAIRYRLQKHGLSKSGYLSKQRQQMLL